MAEDLWVFGYGSLMWRPGFDYDEVASGRLFGWHRAMCILSTHYRGSADIPGLVLGLDRGGSCRGLVFRVAAPRAEAVSGYLHEREMISGVYHPRFAPVHLADGRRVPAYIFVARPDHQQYAGTLSVEETCALIRQGRGMAGTSRDYLANTIDQLDRLGMDDHRLRRLLRLVDADNPPRKTARQARR